MMGNKNNGETLSGAEELEEVEEAIIIPQEATFTGNEIDGEGEDEDEDVAEEPAPGGADADDDDNELEGPDLGASTGNGNERLRAQTLSIAAVASFLALLL